MPAITCGATLVKKLRESGAPPSALTIARRVLEDVHAGEQRIASSAEVIAGLVATLGEQHGAVVRARQFAETHSQPNL